MCRAEVVGIRNAMSDSLVAITYHYSLFILIYNG